VVGIVVVSHSEPLARAAVELALQMVSGDAPPIEVAAGNDGGLGTDAVAVAEAIQRADSASGGAGVLVFTDLGSAILSAELALELVDALHGEVVLSTAPFVEGLVVGVVQASIGQSLSEIDRAASGAVAAKAAQLGSSDHDVIAQPPTQQADSAADDVVSLDVEIVNAQGLHARPAAVFAKAAAGLPVDVAVTNLDTGQGPVDADSMMELMTLGVRQGNRIRLSAAGADARSALESLADLIAAGLGESVA
jgi:dihydroxyacetone kinase phosphotransfer subunit